MINFHFFCLSFFSLVTYSKLYLLFLLNFSVTKQSSRWSSLATAIQKKVFLAGVSYENPVLLFLRKIENLHRVNNQFFKRNKYKEMRLDSLFFTELLNHHLNFFWVKLIIWTRKIWVIIDWWPDKCYIHCFYCSCVLFQILDSRDQNLEQS